MAQKRNMRERPYQLAVIGGAGHVGLPLSLVFAAKGIRTLIVDVNEPVLEMIRQGRLPFMEEGAGPLLRRVLKRNLLGLTTRDAEVRGIPNLILTLGTPVDEFLFPDQKALTQCLRSVAPHLDASQLLVLRSTVAPGTTAWMERFLGGLGARPQIAFCPERVVQGQGIREIQAHPQIVSGTTPEAASRAAALFETVAPEVVVLSPAEAEFAKLLTNVYRYFQFAITNQFYMFVTRAGLDYAKILGGMRHHYPRLKDIPDAGLAAGPCLLKDTMQLAAYAGNQFPMGFDAMAVNEGLPMFIAGEMSRHYPLAEMRVGLLGMAFKADNDDTRSSLSYKLKKLLLREAREVLTTDPYVTSDPDLRPLDEVMASSDLLVLCVPHTPYRRLEVKGKPVVDIWNFFGRGTRIGPA